MKRGTLSWVTLLLNSEATEPLKSRHEAHLSAYVELHYTTVELSIPPGQENNAMPMCHQCACTGRAGDTRRSFPRSDVRTFPENCVKLSGKKLSESLRDRLQTGTFIKIFEKRLWTSKGCVGWACCCRCLGADQKAACCMAPRQNLGGALRSFRCDMVNK